MDAEFRPYQTADGTALPMWLWRPATAAPGLSPDGPPPTVLYLHGIQSHSGWYEASARYLAGRGVAVFQVDRRGSGRDTAHERGHVDRAETWLADVAAAAETARRQTGARAVHLLAVSWGGKVALAAAAHRPDLYRSLVLSAPGLVPRVDLGALMKVRVGECLVRGRERTRFPIPLRDPALFTANPERRRFIAEDPLALHEVTARFLYESRRLDAMVRRAVQVVRVPTLLCLAEHDRIIDNEATRRLIYAMTARRRVRLYPGAHHTLEFEPDPAGYFADLVEWILEAEREARRRPHGPDETPDD